MSDFESGAFNRALPTLRIITYYFSAIYDRVDRFRAERVVPYWCPFDFSRLPIGRRPIPGPRELDGSTA
jgi:hypothetical protein